MRACILSISEDALRTLLELPPFAEIALVTGRARTDGRAGALIQINGIGDREAMNVYPVRIERHTSAEDGLPCFRAKLFE